MKVFRNADAIEPFHFGDFLRLSFDVAGILQFYFDLLIELKIAIDDFFWKSAQGGLIRPVRAADELSEAGSLAVDGDKSLFL